MSHSTVLPITPLSPCSLTHSSRPLTLNSTQTPSETNALPSRWVRERLSLPFSLSGDRPPYRWAVPFRLYLIVQSLNLLFLFEINACKERQILVPFIWLCFNDPSFRKHTHQKRASLPSELVFRDTLEWKKTITTVLLKVWTVQS